MRAFADGCSAITGVEAVSNGVPAFKRPEWRNARTTLTVMGVLVAVMFLGLSWLAGVAGALPSEHETVISQDRPGGLRHGPDLLPPPAGDDRPADPGRQHELRRLPAAVIDPRPRRIHAQPLRVPRRAPGVQRRDRRPRRRGDRGPRRVRGPGRSTHPAVRDRRIHLDHAVAGRDGPPLAPRARSGLAPERRINGFGAVSTAIVTVIFAVAKFALGAWLILLIIPLLVGGDGSSSGGNTAPATRSPGPPRGDHRAAAPRASGSSCPVPEVTRDVIQAVKFARTMSDDVTAVHVTDDLDAGRGACASGSGARSRGSRSSSSSRPTGAGPAAGPVPRDDRRRQAADDVVVVLLPEYVPRHWWERFLYNENARRIRDGLLGRPNILVAEVPFRRDLDPTPARG